MKKRFIAILAMAILAVFALTACGGGGGNTGGGGNAGGSGNASGGGNSGGGAGETYDVGAFTVAVPSGWTAFPQVDIFGDADADGNVPNDPEQILIAEAKDDIDALTKPSVRIYYHKPGVTIFDSRSFYDNVQDISGVKINGVACEAYSGDSMGYTYQFINYPAEDGTYEINVLTSIEGKDTGLTWDSPQVKTITESLKAK